MWGGGGGGGGGAFALFHIKSLEIHDWASEGGSNFLKTANIPVYGFYMDFSRQTHILCVYPYWPHMRLIWGFRVLDPLKTWFGIQLVYFMYS